MACLSPVAVKAVLDHAHHETRQHQTHELLGSSWMPRGPALVTQGPGLLGASAAGSTMFPTTSGTSTCLPNAASAATGGGREERAVQGGMGWPQAHGM